MELPPGLWLDVRQQRRDTLYFVIPPPAATPEDARRPINQRDLWQSGDLFCWMLPRALKLALLRVRQDQPPHR